MSIDEHVEQPFLGVVPLAGGINIAGVRKELRMCVAYAI
jgi:hypothetical protein